MTRAVLVSYYFPPLVGIASERAEAFSRHLSEFGWHPVVVTARNGHYHRTEETGPGVGVIRTPTMEFSRLFRGGYRWATRAPGGEDDHVVEALAPGRVGSALRRLVREYCYVPDGQVGWIPFATRAINDVVAESNGSAVLFSTSVPYSAHFAAMRVAVRRGLPWVAEFRDPWSTSRAPERPQSRTRRRIDRILERRLLARADHVVTLSEGIRQELLEVAPYLPENRVSVIRNGFEPIREGSPPAADEPMTLLYAGNVAAGEDMSVLLRALDAVDAELPGAVRMRVLGPGGAWPSAGRPWLELAGTVSPARARQEMADSSVLVLIQRHEAYRNIVPGKCFEYIGVRRPILALVPPDSEMEALLVEHADVRLVDASVPGALNHALRHLIEQHRTGELQAPRVDPSVTAPLAREEQARHLAEIFDRVCTNRARAGG